jgi:hypothetical protein
MKQSKILIAANCLILALPSFGQHAADYSPESDSIVYGGSYFWRTTQNPHDPHGVYVEPCGVAFPWQA